MGLTQHQLISLKYRWPEISGQETSGLGEIRTVETSGQRRDQDKERSGQGDIRTRRDQDKEKSGQDNIRARRLKDNFQDKCILRKGIFYNIMHKS